nr:MAG TPA: hypothetical protein [Caudoviricetes sp.]
MVIVLRTSCEITSKIVPFKSPLYPRFPDI